ncbi:MAG: hypothetical protein Q4P65_04190 [Eubacteriales bacterium]|nr:hypothetical protein [Eubacteriales bacterium]
MDYIVEIINGRRDAGPSFDFHLKRGELALIIDPEEDVSQTILSVIAGSCFLKTGSVEIFGQSQRIDRRRIAYLPQKAEIKSTQTVEKLTIDWAKALDLAAPQEAMREVLNLVDLAAEAQLPVDDLSREQRDYLLFAGALLGSPDLILINQGAKFMGYRSKKKMLNLLDSLLRLYGVSVVYAASTIDEMVELADVIYIVREQRLVAVDRKHLNSQVRPSTIIETEEPGRAAVLLETADIQYEVLSEKLLEVETEEPWLVNKILVEAGLKLISSIPQENDLKKLIRELVEGERIELL